MAEDRKVAGELRAKGGAAWSVLLAAVALNIAGWFLGWFEQIRWYDDVVHGFTTFAVTFWLALLLYGRSLVGALEHPIMLFLLVVVLGLGLGSSWEIAEWAYDHLSGPQSVIRGKTETILDLIWDSIGAAVAAGWLLMKAGGDARQRADPAA